MPGKYLSRYAEPEARQLLDAPPDYNYQHCLVIPAYREDASLLPQLKSLASVQPGLLIVLVLNQPDSDTSADPNSELRKAITTLPERLKLAVGSLRTLQDSSHLLLVERQQPLPAKEGVGLARKIGCDIALALQASGTVQSRWLHNTDADAVLDDRYFEAAEQQHHCVAITHPFVHVLPADPKIAQATDLYEQRLHYYVLGLRYAGSPYDYHTLGSCISVDAASYAAVRGFPKRAAGEDFYLLNKIAKLGPVARPTTPVIKITGRISDRVPFGTGPAVAELAAAEQPLQSTLFYHPDSFHALRQFLASLELLYAGTELELLPGLPASAIDVLQELGIAPALQHCHKHSRDLAGWSKHFHQWFDGFRTLKFIHGMRDRGLADLNLQESRDHPRSIW
jgi:hypothetical protein